MEKEKKEKEKVNYFLTLDCCYHNYFNGAVKEKKIVQMHRDYRLLFFH